MMQVHSYFDSLFLQPRSNFLMTLFTMILVVCGKVNISNLSCYSTLSEKTYRRQFEKGFDFFGLNLSVIESATESDQRVTGVMDSSFISKSGKKSLLFCCYASGYSP